MWKLCNQLHIYTVIHTHYSLHHFSIFSWLWFEQVAATTALSSKFLLHLHLRLNLLSSFFVCKTPLISTLWNNKIIVMCGDRDSHTLNIPNALVAKINSKLKELLRIFLTKIKRCRYQIIHGILLWLWFFLYNNESESTYFYLTTFCVNWIWITCSDHPTTTLKSLIWKKCPHIIKWQLGA